MAALEQRVLAQAGQIAIGQEVAFTGFTTLVTLILFLGGVQLIGIGILGEYMGRIYDEAKRRPLYVLRPPEAKS
jgi:hypothetical protein